ncbi:TetR/AcrR family transcriptional regulator [Streptomyces lunaelactis]|uniref:TetR/AcrR family transcriptional regulator n=1 Tax=Streptomyces lunaelactis TaxID=1535768 RepID=UPI0015855315|nr:TetR/AcrR family transcriptional regulator [Streptomyces lunaelactis]NUL02062.1 TetR/AcrR family transcriptional regulator [Streptomyces lunaelactis]
MVRMSADERRESVIRAAITEFARGGYNGTSTEVIAKRVGVSQPYLFRLFKNKRELFLAAALRCLEETPRVFADAMERRPGRSPLEAMAAAYMELIDDRDKLLMQMQTYVAVASAEAAGDHEFGERIRAAWAEVWDQAQVAFGGDAKESVDFLGCGMLINVLVALGFPEDHRVWSGLDMSDIRAPR